jgi:tetratricopeptide (TPR) repeat protein
MFRHRLRLLASLALALGAGSAFAQEDVGDAPAAVDVSAAAPTVVLEAGAPATYDGAVLLGTRKIVLRDFESALKELREAASRKAARPEAYCRLGDAQLANADVPEARAAYETCLRFAQKEQDPHQLALALVGLARSFEREHKHQEARDAWQRVVTSAKDDAAQALAQARISVLDVVLKQQEAYVTVRARIAERESQAAPIP